MLFSLNLCDGSCVEFFCESGSESESLSDMTPDEENLLREKKRIAQGIYDRKAELKLSIESFSADGSMFCSLLLISLVIVFLAPNYTTVSLEKEQSKFMPLISLL